MTRFAPHLQASRAAAAAPHAMLSHAVLRRAAAPRSPGVISPELLEEVRVLRSSRTPSVTDPAARPDVRASRVSEPAAAEPAGVAAMEEGRGGMDGIGPGTGPGSGPGTGPGTGPGPATVLVPPGSSLGSYPPSGLPGPDRLPGGASGGSQREVAAADAGGMAAFTGGGVPLGKERQRSGGVVEVVSRAGSDPLFGEEEIWWVVGWVAGLGPAGGRSGGALAGRAGGSAGGGRSGMQQGMTGMCV